MKIHVLNKTWVIQNLRKTNYQLVIYVLQKQIPKDKYV